MYAVYAINAIYAIYAIYILASTLSGHQRSLGINNLWASALFGHQPSLGINPPWASTLSGHHPSLGINKSCLHTKIVAVETYYDCLTKFKSSDKESFSGDT